MIAVEAYKQLSPELKGKVTEILKSHPDYQKWKESYEKAGQQNFDLPTFIFMRSSTWPDEIRRGGGSDKQYNHPHWHYVDYPLTPPSFKVLPGPSPTDDVLYGITQSEKTLSDPAASPELRAVYLSYLIHLIGDMHQPLHCCSLVNSTYPKGDKGGNDFYVTPGTRGIKLHSLWDGLLGTSGKPQTHINYAVAIESKYPRKSLSELTEHTTPKDWSLESRELAVEKAYLHRAEKGSTEADTAPALAFRLHQDRKDGGGKAGSVGRISIGG